jgi:uncharacterized protein (DUF2384 family)
MTTKSSRKDRPPYHLLPGEKEDIRQEAATLVAEPEKWLDNPHPLLGGQRPNDLIGTDQELHLRNLLRRIKFGIPP